MTLRIGTRGSELALWQARRVAELLADRPDAPPVELVRIRTEGDARADIPLWKVGGQAFFTREIDRAVLSGEVDAAVHSLKDLGTVLDEGLGLAAVLEREDLLERVWGYDVFPSTRTVDNFILRLRKRFERDPANPRHFLTVWGVGYRFVAEGEPTAAEGEP